MIVEGEDQVLLIGPPEVRGVSLLWLRHRTLQLTDAPVWYSMSARMLGVLCPSCDLGLYSCECPEAELIDGRVIQLWPR